MDAKQLGMTAVNPQSMAQEGPFGGITLRQHFAGLAMQGILANRVYDPPRRDRLAMMAVDAVSAADCLLTELAKDRT